MHIPTIVTVGKAVQDVFLKSSRSFERHEHKGVMYEQLPVGQKLDVEEIVFATGGNVTNAAVTFARQGLHSRYVWGLGKDIASETILRELDKEGVDTGFVDQDDQYHAGYSTILMLQAGERTILNYKGAMPKAGGVDLSALQGSDWVYLSALGDIQLLEEVVSYAREHDIKVMLNPAGSELKETDKLKGLLEDVEVLSLNKEEAQQIVSGSTTEELVRHALHYCPVVIVSDGPHGAVASDGKTIVKAGMYEDVTVVDRTGGGDAFGSGFLSYWAQGKSLKESIVFASANSTSVVQSIGAKSGILHKDTVRHDMPLTEEAL